MRAGGNRFTAYNWENNASNAGTDYCNQNDTTFGGPGSPPANGFRAMLDDARARGTAAIVTVPIVDHVAADHDDLGDHGQGAPACVGDVQNSGPGYLASRFAANHARKGTPFASSPDLGDDAVYQDELVAWVRSNYADVELLVSLDNEPDLWSSTHPRVHPSPVTYAELIERNVDFADAVKDAAPEVETLGFVSYGYTGYVSLQSAPDADGEFLAHYLEAMAMAEGVTGHRLVDYLDLHWYPEARGDGIRITSASDATGAEARMEAPRSLWDPTYREDSWIANDYLDGPIALLPWLRARIDEHYPGTGLAFSEWNFGGGDHVSGAIATADVLGILGREGVGLATLWLLSGDEPFTRAGLRAYTNYDGAGGAFGETSILSTSDDEDVVVHASEAAGGRLVLVAIHKGASATTASLSVAGSGSYTQVERWVLQGSSAEFVSASAVGDSGDDVFVVELPARSVSVWVVR